MSNREWDCPWCRGDEGAKKKDCGCITKCSNGKCQWLRNKLLGKK